MTIEIKNLIAALEHPLPCAANYHGDLTSDIINVLSQVQNAQADADVITVHNKELINLLPGDDIFDELIDNLQKTKDIDAAVAALQAIAENFERNREVAAADYRA